MLLYAEPGTEQFIPFARRKLELWKAQYAAAGVPSFHKRVDVSDGSTIYVDSVLLANGRYNDRIRVTGGQKGRLLGGDFRSTDPGHHRLYYEQAAGLVAMRASSTGAVSDAQSTQTVAAQGAWVEWSKDRSTCVAAGVNADASVVEAEVMRAVDGSTVRQIIPWVGGYITGFDFAQFSQSGLDARQNPRSRHLVGMDRFGVSNDGKTLLFKSTAGGGSGGLSDFLVRCVWNDTTQLYDVTRVPIPAAIQAFVDAMAPAVINDTGAGVFYSAFSYQDPTSYGVVMNFSFPVFPRFWLNPYSGTEVYVEFEIKYVNASEVVVTDPSPTGVGLNTGNRAYGQWLYQIWKYDALTGEWTLVHDRGTKPYSLYWRGGNSDHFQFPPGVSANDVSEESDILFEPTSRVGSRFSWRYADEVISTVGSYNILGGLATAVYLLPQVVRTPRVSTSVLRDGAAWVENVPLYDPVATAIAMGSVGDGGRGFVAFLDTTTTPATTGFLWRGLAGEPVVRGNYFNHTDNGTWISRSGRRLYAYNSAGKVTMYLDGVLVWTDDPISLGSFIRTSFSNDAKFQTSGPKETCSVAQQADSTWALTRADTQPQSVTYEYPDPSVVPQTDPPTTLSRSVPGSYVIFDEFIP